MTTQLERLRSCAGRLVFDVLNENLYQELRQVLGEASNPPPLGAADGSVSLEIWTDAFSFLRAVESLRWAAPALDVARPRSMLNIEAVFDAVTEARGALDEIVRGDTSSKVDANEACVFAHSSLGRALDFASLHGAPRTCLSCKRTLVGVGCGLCSTEDVANAATHDRCDHREAGLILRGVLAGRGELSR